MTRFRSRFASALALIAAAMVFCSSPALANYVVKDGAGATQTMCSVVAAGVQSPCHASPDAAASGTINSATSNAAYTVTLGQAQGVVGFTVSGLSAAGAVLTIEGSNDGGATWSAVSKVDGSTGVLASTVSTDSQFRIDAGGRTAVRLRVSSIGSGTVSVASNASKAQTGTTLTAPLPPGSNLIGGTLIAASSTDASGTVTTGGAYQSLFASNASRKGCLVQNPTTATEILSVKLGTMSAPFNIPIGGTFSCRSGDLVVTDAITITAATTAHAFVAVSQ